MVWPRDGRAMCPLWPVPSQSRWRQTAAVAVRSVAGPVPDAPMHSVTRMAQAAISSACMVKGARGTNGQLASGNPVLVAIIVPSHCDAHRAPFPVPFSASNLQH